MWSNAAVVWGWDWAVLSFGLYCGDLWRPGGTWHFRDGKRLLGPL